MLKNLVCQVGEPRPASKDSKKISVQQLSEADITSQTMTRLADSNISFNLPQRLESVQSMIKKIVFDNTINCGAVLFYPRDSSSVVCKVKLDTVRITNLAGGLEISFICSFHNFSIRGVGGFDTINMLISNECIGGAWNMGFLTMTTGGGYSVPNGSSATDDRVQSCINLVLGTLTGVV